MPARERDPEKELAEKARGILERIRQHDETAVESKKLYDQLARVLDMLAASRAERFGRQERRRCASSQGVDGSPQI